MSEPIVVVQGTPVGDPKASSAKPYVPSVSQSQPAAAAAGNSSSSTHFGQVQETRCRDIPFAILFYLNLAAVIGIAAAYGPSAFDTEDGDTGAGGEERDYTGYLIATVILTIISFFGSAISVAIMMKIPQLLIKLGLFFVVGMSGLFMVMAFASGSIGVGILGAVFFALMLCYARAVWSRIPFATANLVTACTAIQSNVGVVAYAYIFAALAGGWSILWTIAFAGIFNETDSCDNVNNTCEDVNYGYLFLLLIAFYFTHQVLQNSVHVTVAGTVGTWWFEPSECGCCASAVTSSFIRTITTSFGSICFGSLIVAILEALRTLANSARANDDGNAILLCIAECLLACLASIVEYFNRWAFIYVGIYGYGYLEAGKQVFTLFHNRGWDAVIADDLVNNTLMLMALLTGCVIGCIGIILHKTSDFFEDAGGDGTVVSFVIGLLVGAVVSSIAFSTIGSAVNAVIVLFADAPADFQRNHPQLSQKMRETWSQVYPGSV